MSSYFGEEIEKILAFEVLNLLAVNFDLAVIDRECFQQCSSPIVYMLVGHHHPQRMDLCFCEE